MLFLFPKKKIVLDCFTDRELILQTAPITNAMMHIPSWWKKLPNSFFGESFFPKPTMKGCVGMIDYYAKSVALPLWSDLMINVDSNKNYQWQFSDISSQATVHNSKQRTDFLNDYGHLKLITPWLLKTKEDIKWFWSQPIYNFSSNAIDIKILPGITSFKHQHSINVNMMLPLNQSNKYFLEQGQVLAHLTPLSDRKFKVVRHLISQSEYIKMYNSNITFVNIYKNVIKRRNNFLSCPYKKETKK
jgi:hypothetical protein